MSMPNHVVFVRHGESEGNYVREMFKKGPEGDFEYLINQFRERPGGEWRLTPKGVEEAQAAGAWIQENIIEHYGLPGFDRYIYSPHRRTIETAGHLGIPGADWRLNRMLRERSWGELENLTGDQEHESLYPQNYEWMQRDPLNWAPPGGISIAQLADTQVKGVFDTMHRDHDEKCVDSYLASTHGEWMWGARLYLEYMLNEDWDAAKGDPIEKIHNCQVIELSRLDPTSGEQAPYLKWMRSVNPYRGETDAAWRELGRKILTNGQMIALAEAIPRITHPFRSALPPEAASPEEIAVLSRAEFSAHWGPKGVNHCWGFLCRLATENADFPLRPVADGNGLQGDICEAISWMEQNGKSERCSATILKRVQDSR